MPNYPSISRGIGKLTPSLWTRLMAMLQWFEVDRVTLDAIKMSDLAQPGQSKKYFLAKITGSAYLTGLDTQYKYDWTEVVLDNTTGFVDRPNGLDGTSALNLCELSNTNTNVSPGVDLLGADYPEGFTMRAIGDCIDDTRVNPVVVMFVVRDEDNCVRYVFSLANAHDGECE